MIGIPRSRSRLRALRDEIPPAHQVVGGGAEAKLPIDEPTAAVTQLAKQGDGLQPAECLLDELAFPMTEAKADVSRRACVDGAAAVPKFVRRHVRRDAHLTNGRDPRADVVRLIGGHGDATRRERQLAEHGDRRTAFTGPGGRRNGRVDDQAMPVLREQVAEIRQLRFAADGFLVQPRVGIGRRLVRVIAARLSMEIDGRILRVVGWAAGATFWV